MTVRQHQPLLAGIAAVVIALSALFLTPSAGAGLPGGVQVKAQDRVAPIPGPRLGGETVQGAARVVSVTTQGRAGVTVVERTF